MKVQCDCGAKYAFDSSPEMVRNPVTFACPGCGADLSPRLNALIREAFGNVTGPGVPAAPPPVGVAPKPEIAPPPPSMARAAAPPIAPPPPPPPPVSAPVPVARLRRTETASAPAPAEDVTDQRFCPKHPQQRVTETCRVCGKGICPKCMQLFGYVCSPHCREKAEAQGIILPAYAGQRDTVERQYWGKIGLVVKLSLGVLALVLGVWFWYAWFGQRPKAAFAVRFEDEPAMSGESAICDNGQIVFLHGDKLARYDWKAKRQIWLRHLLDRKKLTDEAAAEYKELQEAAAQGRRIGRMPTLEDLTQGVIRSAERELELHVRGQNIWVFADGKAKRFDWDSGEPKQEVAFAGGFSRAIQRGDELEFRERREFGRMAFTRFNLATGQSRMEEIGDLPPAPAAARTNAIAKGKPGAGGAKAAAIAAATAPKNKKLDPQKLGDAVAGASVPAKLASPATLSMAMNQRRTAEAMEDMEDTGAGSDTGLASADLAGLVSRDHTTLVPTADGFIQFTTRLVERRIVERNAMKAAPKKSALDGNVSVTSTLEVANELLNEMQRNAGGGIVREDESRYHVKVHLGGDKGIPDWEADVVGPPALYPQQTVNAVVAGKSLIVLDKSNQKKWESALTYRVAEQDSYFGDEEEARAGYGPVVERGDTLYIYDQGVLSAFEAATGNARWRLPSVGITGLFFDGAGMVYANTTTASPEQIKYSKQIDVTDRTGDIVVKLDPKTGREIWRHSFGGTIAYLQGQYIYTLSYLPPVDDDEEISPEMVAMGVQTRPYVRIRRINPKDGQVLWDHFQQRGALDVKVHENTFQIVFKKEVQVLKFLAF
jgi:outer membrane protein assembly factor BamB